MFTRIRVSWANDQGQKWKSQERVDPALIGSVARFTIMASSSYSNATFSSLNIFADMFTIFLLVFIICTISIGIRQWLFGFRREDPSSIPTLASKEAPELFSYDLLFGVNPSKNNIPLTMQYLLTPRQSQRMLQTISFLVVMPGKESFLQSGVLPPTGVATTIFPVAEHVRPKKKKKKWIAEFIPLQIIKRSAAFDL